MRVVHKLVIRDELGERVYENCVAFKWEGHEHFVGVDACPACFLPSLTCKKDGGLRHTEFFRVDDDGYALLNDQCDRELPEDPNLYGVGWEHGLPIRVPWSPDQG